MGSTNAAVRQQLQPSDFVVSRCGMCATFWCGVILLLSSIVLLVTGRHKGRLYQSWGSVMLGCGCCLMLICVILCIHAYLVMSDVARNRQLGLNEQTFETTPVPDARRLVSNDDETHLLLADSPPTRPVNGCQESSTSVKSSSERRARLTRMPTVDDDSGSQTSSSCPTSSSSMSTTPPGSYQLPSVRVHEAARAKRTGLSTAMGDTAAQFQVSTVKPMIVACRVRPLTDVDWRRGDHLPFASVNLDAGTSGPATEASDRLGCEPVRRQFGPNSAVRVTPLTNRRHVQPPSSSLKVPRPCDDHCAISVDDILMSDQNAAAESEVTVYDNVQQLHV